MSDNPHNFSPSPFSESSPSSLQGQQWQGAFPTQDGNSTLINKSLAQNEKYTQSQQLSPSQPFGAPASQPHPITSFRPSPSLSGISPLAEPRGLPQRPTEHRAPLVRPDKVTSWPWRPTARLVELRSQLAAPRIGQLHHNARLSQQQAQGLWGWFKQQDKNKQIAILCCLIALLLLCSSTLLLFAGNGDTASDTTSNNAPTQATNQDRGSTPTQTLTPSATTTPTATPTTSVMIAEPTPTSQPVVQDNTQNTQTEDTPTPTPTTTPATPTPEITIPTIISIETPPADTSTESAVP